MKPFFTLLFCFIAFFTRAGGQAGQLDPTFGVEGKYSYSLDGEYLGSFGLQSSNKVIAAGAGYDISSGLGDYIYTVRFLADGGIDSSFGNHGFSDFLIGIGSNKGVYNIAIQPDDKIVAVGRTEYFAKQNFFVARFTADGGVDSAFGDNGFIMVPITISANDHARTVNILPDNRILISGKAGILPAYLRIHENGDIDSSFGTYGVSFLEELPFGVTLRDTEIQDDGKIVSTLYVIGGGSPMCVVRLNANGTKDLDFGASGLTIINYPHPAIPNDIFIQNDNKILLTGNLEIVGTSPTQYKIAMSRLNPDGTLDHEFGTSGKIISSLSDYLGREMSYILQPTDEKILCFNPLFKPGIKNLYQTARYIDNGTLDLEWNGSGVRVDTFVENYYHNPLKIFYTDEGQVLYIGVSYQYIGTSADQFLDFARLNSCHMSITDGPADATGAAGGSATFSAAATSPSAVYRWQRAVSADSWEDLSDAMPQYGGTTTATLTVSHLTLENHSERYRAIGISGSCTDTSGSAVLSVTPTSNDDIYFSTVSLYPNPVQDLLTIDPGSLMDGLSIEIIDASGKQLHSTHYGERPGHPIYIDTKGWPSGNYFVLLHTDSGKSATYKISKK